MTTTSTASTVTSLARPLVERRSNTRAALTLTAAYAPIVWGTTYLVTSEFLPASHPMTASVLRAVPAGLLLLALAPGVPPIGWRWKTVVLGMLNIGFFFPLLFLAAYRLPGGLAAVVGAIQPLVVASLARVLGWGRISRTQLTWCLVALTGVAMTTLTGHARLDWLGLLAAVCATVSMATGILLTRRWSTPPVRNPLTITGWQLLVGGVVIIPLVPVIDSGPWHVDGAAIGGYAWLAVMGGAVAYALWFRGARSLPATNVALLGMLSPLTAAVLGWLVLGQTFSPLQCAGFVLALLGSCAGQLVAAARR